MDLKLLKPGINNEQCLLNPRVIIFFQMYFQKALIHLLHELFQFEGNFGSGLQLFKLATECN